MDEVGDETIKIIVEIDEIDDVVVEEHILEIEVREVNEVIDEIHEVHLLILVEHEDEVLLRHDEIYLQIQ